MTQSIKVEDFSDIKYVLCFMLIIKRQYHNK